MDKKIAAQLLANVPLFSKMNKRSLVPLADRLIERKFAAGDRIIEQGNEGFGLFIIASGTAEVRFEDEDGNITVVNELGEGDFFGEMALLDDEPRSASVFAKGETLCLFLNRIEFMACMMKDAEMGVAVSAELARRLRRSLAS
ncbi:MAG TPA: cyclic nucleotide-binding domain-containing protein [Chloroflexi bacterium]|nr:cyclic nucleotide-binding domain-containing protein [Chloroflexota bacterium]